MAKDLYTPLINLIPLKTPMDTGKMSFFSAPQETARVPAIDVEALQSAQEQMQRDISTAVETVNTLSNTVINMPTDSEMVLNLRADWNLFIVKENVH